MKNRFINNTNIRLLAAAISIAAVIAAGMAAIHVLSGGSDPASTGAAYPAGPGKGVTVYAAGDIADCRKYPANRNGAFHTAALIAAGLEREPDAMVLALGDNSYPIGLLAEFNECYHPSWGQFKQRTHPAPGNHEYYSPEANGYFRYFGEAAGPSRRGYYRTRIGNWDVFSLNSNLRQSEHQTQLEWLQKELKRKESLCTLAFWHHPRFSSGGHGSNPKMDDIWRTLSAAGAELVLAAHDHDYERFAPLDADGKRDDRQGMRSFVIGTGGAELTPFRFRHDDSEVAHNATAGVLKLVLKASGYEWEFMPIPKSENHEPEFMPKSDGLFQDSGTGLCR